MRFAVAITLLLAVATGADAATLSMTVSPGSVLGGTAATARLTLSSAAPAGGLAVSLSASDPRVVFADPVTKSVVTSVQIAPGTSFKDVAVRSVPVAQVVNVQLTAASAVGKAAAMLAISPPAVQAVTTTVANVVGGDAVELAVTLTGPAPRGGLPLAIASATLPLDTRATPVVPEGATSARLRVGTLPVPDPTAGEIKVSTSAGGAAVRQTLYPPAVTALTLSPSTMAGMGRVLATIAVSHAAPSGGLPVSLQRSTPSPSVAVGVPSPVVIPAGQRSATFALDVRAPDSATATEGFVAATAGGRAQSSLAIVPLMVTNVQLSAQEVRAGSPVNVTVTRNGVSSTLVPLEAVEHYLMAPQGSWGTYTGQGGVTPSQVAVDMGGNLSASVTLTTLWRFEHRRVQIRAGGTEQSRTASFDLLPIQVAGVEMRRRIGGVTQSEPMTSGVVGSGEELEFRAQLDVAPFDGTGQVLHMPVDMQLYNLSYSRVQVPVTVGNPLVVFNYRVPARTVASEATLGFSGINGPLRVSLWVNPPSYTISLLSPQVQGNAVATGTVTVDVPPEVVGTGKLVYALESSNPAVASPTSASVASWSGSNTMNFQVSTRAVAAPTQVLIKAGGTPGDFSTGSVATLTVTP